MRPQGLHAAGGLDVPPVSCQTSNDTVRVWVVEMVDSLALSAYERCTLCPRRCGVNRTAGELGWCHSSAYPRVARASLHQWEEPVISGDRGSGTVFFVGCPLGCVYCQNHEISHAEGDAGVGKRLDVARLAELFCSLQRRGAHNINLVTPTHHAPHVVAAVAQARAQGLTVPIVYNTSGYERPEMIALLAGTVDVWLTDFKYAIDAQAERHAKARGYPKVARAALVRMRQNLLDAGGRSLGSDGTLRRGIIVRHLLLPDGVRNALGVLDAIAETCGTHEVDVSVMNQYTPTPAARAFGEPLDRPVHEAEYERVLDYADEIDFEHLWWQEGGTVSESFIPAWDETGLT